jgi:hypothetical protein
VSADLEVAEAELARSADDTKDVRTEAIQVVWIIEILA